MSTPALCTPLHVAISGQYVTTRADVARLRFPRSPLMVLLKSHTTRCSSCVQFARNVALSLVNFRHERTSRVVSIKVAMHEISLKRDNFHYVSSAEQCARKIVKSQVQSVLEYLWDFLSVWFLY